MRSVSEREYQFITQATRDAYSFPATFFEQSLLQCIDSQTGTVNSVQLGRKFMRLIKETRSVLVLSFFVSVGWRTLLSY